MTDTSTELAPLTPTKEERVVLAATPEWAKMATLWQAAKVLAEKDNSIAPDAIRGKPGAVFQMLWLGSELGIPPVAAMMQLYVVKGKVGMSASLMRGIIRDRGHKLEILEKTDEVCTLKGTRRDSGDTETVTWTMDDAKKAGLIAEGGAWTTYPRRMLYARATSELWDSLFSDISSGVRYTPEELNGPVARDDLEDNS